MFSEVFQAASETISDMVTNAMRKGFALGQLAVVVERHFDGRIVAGCTVRSEIARRFTNDRRLTEEAKSTIVAEMTGAAADELPIVVVVHQGEGLVAVGVRRERGQLVAVS